MSNFINNIPTKNTSCAPAAKYIKDDTEEYYYLANDQYTVGIFNSEYENILTDEGIELFNVTQKKYDREEWKDTFKSHVIENSLSGFWFPDKSSKYYKNDEYSCLNTWKNINVTGFSNKQNDYLRTSVVVFITDDWCLTKSGSLYKFAKET